MKRLTLVMLAKALCCCLLLVGFSFIQVSPDAFADDNTTFGVKDSQGAVTVSLDTENGNIYAGGSGHVGDLVLQDKKGKSSAHVGGNGDIELGGNGHDAKVE
ncbi:MAG: hypothetical protein DSM106950_13395, partial [Stigonema ocellatum SAG 48.90 = DSM 106950]|nr:hypothetical protein [Stigonema ocellatum SAG 48.90 = DSM 106950]